MRPDHRQARLRPARRRGYSGASCGWSSFSAPSGRLGVGVKHAADRGEERVLPARREQRDARRQRRRCASRPAAASPQRSSRLTKLVQVPSRLLSWIGSGEHLRDGVDRRRRRQQQRVDAAEDDVADAAQLFQLGRRPLNVSAAVGRAPSRMILRVTGWMGVGRRRSSSVADREHSARRPTALRKAAARSRRTARCRSR